MLVHWKPVTHEMKARLSTVVEVSLLRTSITVTLFDPQIQCIIDNITLAESTKSVVFFMFKWLGTRLQIYRSVPCGDDRKVIVVISIGYILLYSVQADYSRNRRSQLSEDDAMKACQHPFCPDLVGRGQPSSTGHR